MIDIRKSAWRLADESMPPPVAADELWGLERGLRNCIQDDRDRYDQRCIWCGREGWQGSPRDEMGWHEMLIYCESIRRRCWTPSIFQRPHGRWCSWDCCVQVGSNIQELEEEMRAWRDEKERRAEWFEEQKAALDAAKTALREVQTYLRDRHRAASKSQAMASGPPTTSPS